MLGQPTSRSRGGGSETLARRPPPPLLPRRRVRPDNRLGAMAAYRGRSPSVRGASAASRGRACGSKRSTARRGSAPRWPDPVSRWPDLPRWRRLTQGACSAAASRPRCGGGATRGAAQDRGEGRSALRRWREARAQIAGRVVSVGGGATRGSRGGDWRRRRQTAQAIEATARRPFAAGARARRSWWSLHGYVVEGQSA